MDGVTLDQIKVFLAIVDEGSFPKAAKSLNRAPSAVTYAIRNLEAQVGVQLFDRSAYRSALTPGGRALLVRARRLTEEADAFREQARSLARGLEPELAIVIDAMYPMAAALEALRALAERFPTVPPRVYVQTLGAAARLVLDGTCAIGLLPSVVTDLTTLRLRPTNTIELVPVAAPSHPLAAVAGSIGASDLDRHVQLVLTDASSITAEIEHGVLSSRTWRLADLGAKKAMLLAGLGWGTMPDHLIADELADGRLQRLDPEGLNGFATSLVLGAAFVAETGLGPAGRWLLDLLGRPAD